MEGQSGHGAGFVRGAVPCAKILGVLYSTRTTIGTLRARGRSLPFCIAARNESDIRQMLLHDGVPADRVVKVGNASLRGAREFLLSVTARAAAERLARSIEHVELETAPDFFDLFVDGCQFKPLEDGSSSRRASARG